MDFWEIYEKQHSQLPRKEMMGYRVNEDAIKEAYKCGFKDGYKEAIKDESYSDELYYGERKGRRESDPEVRYMGERRM